MSNNDFAIRTRLAELAIDRLGDDIGVSYDEPTEGASLHTNLSAHIPNKIAVLNGNAMWALVNWWTDGYCPTCGDSIPQNDYLCSHCLDEAIRNQRPELLQPS